MILKVAVIGTTFVDCKGFAKQAYNPYGRNLGYIRFVHGGVGRNVVENLAYLGLPATFVSAVDNSALGKEVVTRLTKSNINIDYLAYAEDKGMGMWLAILDQAGNLAGSISQMPDLTILEKHIDQKGQEVIKDSSHVVLELDLNSNISNRVIQIAKDLGKPVYGIPGNLDVILKHPELLKHIDCFICNEIEAGKLIGKDLSSVNEVEMQAQLVAYVTDNGIKSMVITMGERGAVYFDSQSGECGYQPAFPTRLKDSTGAGDAFFSGTVMGLVRQRPLSEAVIYGAKVASWTIQVDESTCSRAPEMMKRDEHFKVLLKNIKAVV